MCSSDICFFENLRVEEQDGKVHLVYSEYSFVYVNPDMEEARDLSEWLTKKKLGHLPIQKVSSSQKCIEETKTCLSIQGIHELHVPPETSTSVFVYCCISNVHLDKDATISVCKICDEEISVGGLCHNLICPMLGDAVIKVQFSISVGLIDHTGSIEKIALPEEISENLLRISV
eukprot:TRINITY_DN1056_c0_g1_i7.p1 TRINITY_DN1056_c0_g1~~TRINITY_DN1056_c0_g1_i7.p1  ORF type:complete len:174 (-),score=24.14 TRINITY_DN1056_c0_g1_i7:355-876(-)